MELSRNNIQPADGPAVPPLECNQTTATFPWIAIGWYTVLLIVLFAPVLYYMVHEWITMDEMGHGNFVPLLAIYVAWQERERLAGIPVRGSWAGLFLIGLGFLQMIAGFLGADYFVARTALMLCIIGILATTLGWRMVKALAFPLFILLFMFRLPLFIYSRITLPLQMLASVLAEHTLGILGIPVLREGNVLELSSAKLSVVEACSGIRSLLTLALLGLVYGYFFDQKKWMRWVLLLLSVPIAIIANSLRVSLTGIMSQVKKEFAEGIYHMLEGWVVFMVALVVLVIAHQVINRVHAMIRKPS